MDDATIQAARRGDRAAQATLLRALQDRWYRFSLSLLRDADAARDATQEAAVRFLRLLHTFRAESRLDTWSMGIVLNVVREHRRWQARDRPGHPEPPPPAALSSPFAAAERSEDHDRLRRLIDELPDRQRQVTLLRFFEELSTEETAQAMGCTAGTVKAALHQAIRALRTRLRPRDRRARKHEHLETRA